MLKGTLSVVKHTFEPDGRLSQWGTPRRDCSKKQRHFLGSHTGRTGLG
jgi:hypothetical protein